MSEPWLKKGELAAALQVSVRTIERRKPPGMEVGGQKRYRLSEVERFFRGEGQPAMVVDLHPTREGSAA